MLTLLLTLLFLGAAYYSFRKFAKAGGCGCGCDSANRQINRNPGGKNSTQRQS